MNNRHLVRTVDPPSSKEALRRARIEAHRQIAYDIIDTIPHPFTAREVRAVAVEWGYGIDVAESIRRRVHEMYEQRSRPDSGRLVSVGRDWSRGGMLLMPMDEVDDVIPSPNGNGDSQAQTGTPRKRYIRKRRLTQG